MSSLSNEDRQTLARLLETLSYETLNYLNPGEDIREMVIDDDKSHVNLRGRLVQYGLLPTPQAERHGGKKRKTIR